MGSAGNGGTQGLGLLPGVLNLRRVIRLRCGNQNLTELNRLWMLPIYLCRLGSGLHSLRATNMGEQKGHDNDLPKAIGF